MMFVSTLIGISDEQLKFEKKKKEENFIWLLFFLSFFWLFTEQPSNITNYFLLKEKRQEIKIKY